MTTKKEFYAAYRAIRLFNRRLHYYWKLKGSCYSELDRDLHGIRYFTICKAFISITLREASK